MLVGKGRLLHILDTKYRNQPILHSQLAMRDVMTG